MSNLPLSLDIFLKGYITVEKYINYDRNDRQNLRHLLTD